MSDFLTRLELAHPIIQAPMAGVSTPAMAAGVANAGGLGSLGLGASSADVAGKMLSQARALTNGALNANVFCHAPAVADAAKQSAWLARMAPEFARFDATPPDQLSEIYQSFLTDDAMFQMLLDQAPNVVSLHFGLPSADRIGALRDKGIFLMATATNPTEARLIQDAGIDAVVAQGWEAGGHRGMFDPSASDSRLGTLALTRILARDLSIPVIAAGGIMDSAGIRAALDLGAAAAQLGTAFIGCFESSANDGYRAALSSDAAHETLMTPILSGRPARSLTTPLTRWGQDAETAEVPAYPIAYDAAKALAAAALAKGDQSFGAQWAGQGAPLAKVNVPVAEIMADLVAGL